MTQIKTALVSVSDKSELAPFAQRLGKMGVHILSTGGTARLLAENGVEVQEVADYTGFPEIMNGRVKSLHPKIHGGLLAVRDNEDHMRQLAELDIRPIDMVVCNLYPFEETIAKPDVEFAEAIENIDIGGPTMIRSAAKNHADVAVITNPGRYDEVATKMEQMGGSLDDDTLFELALEAFRHTAHYDTAISQYLAEVRKLR